MKFESGHLAELSPATPLEHTLAQEIIHAAWHLRRCASLEIAPAENLTDEELDRLQTSIDRARAAAQRTFHRSLKELRRLQAEPASGRGHNQAGHGGRRRHDEKSGGTAVAGRSGAGKEFCTTTQSLPEKTAVIPRSAPCPCESGEKYKRC